MPAWIDGTLVWAVFVAATGVLVWVGRWIERWTSSGSRISDLEAANPGQRLDDIERRISRLETVVDRLIWKGGAVRFGPKDEG